MTERGARRLAQLLLLVTGLLYAASVAAVVAGWGTCGESWQRVAADGGRACRIMLGNNDVGGGAETLGFGLLGVLFVGLGGLLAIRRHRNRLAWVFLFGGLIFIVNALANILSLHAAEAPGAVPFGTAAAVVAEVVGGPVVFAPFVLFFLLFPDGHVLSRRWRIAVWAVLLSAAAQSVALLFNPDTLRLAPLTPNPVGIAWLGGAIGDALEMTIVLLPLALVASVVGLVIRFRRSQGIERQQMKWFLSSGAFVGVTLLLGPVFWAVPQLEVLWGPLFMTATASIPIAATIAILRYRLYELDVLVNRALVYGLLTGLLGALYLGLVFALQAALSGLGDGSNLAVAGSTLAVAALFGPLRSRVQDFINRRFYRRKYNALQTVEAFSARLRQETDVAALRAELLQVIDTTVQPAGAVVWLRGDAGRAT